MKEANPTKYYTFYCIEKQDGTKVVSWELTTINIEINHPHYIKKGKTQAEQKAEDEIKKTHGEDKTTIIETLTETDLDKRKIKDINQYTAELLHRCKTKPLEDNEPAKIS